jgi:hypothetical protein
MHFSPLPRHFIPLWSKYPPQHYVLKHPQFSLNVRDQVSHPYRQSYSLVHSNVYISYWQQTGRQKALDWMVARIVRIESPLNLLRKQILIYFCVPQIFELWHIFKQSVCYFYVPNLTCILLTSRNIYLVFSTIISRPTSLLASVKFPVIFCILSYLPVDSKHQRKPETGVSH